jgi:HEAT repeat protein
MRFLSLTLLLLVLAGCGTESAPTRAAKATASTKPGGDLEAFLRAEELRGLGAKGKEAAPILIKALDDKNRLVREAAIETLGQLGAEARDAVPMLVPQLEHDAYRPAVLKALAKIGGAGVPAIAAGLKDERVNVRAGAAEALGRIGSAAQSATPFLVAALDDKAPEVRRAAAEALGRIGGDAEEIRLALQSKLTDESEPVRFHAAEALIRLDPKQQNALEALVKGLKDAEDPVRARAAAALGKMGPHAKPAWSPLAETLAKDTNPAVRSVSAKSLGRIDPLAAVPLLIAALRDPEVQVRNAAAEALGDIGPAAKDAIPALTEAMKPLNGREAAYQAIRKIQYSTGN